MKELTDEQWQRIAPLFPKKDLEPGGNGRPRRYQITRQQPKDEHVTKTGSHHYFDMEARIPCPYCKKCFTFEFFDSHILDGHKGVKSADPLLNMDCPICKKQIKKILKTDGSKESAIGHMIECLSVTKHYLITTQHKPAPLN